MSYDYTNVGLNDSNNNTGLSEKLLIAPTNWLTTIATPSATPSAPGDEVLITADHVFDTGKGFIEIDATQDTVDLISEIVGDNADSLSNKFTLNGFLAGLTPENLEFVKNMKNDSFIILMKDCNRYYQLGSNCGSLVKGQGTISTGKRSGGAKGHNLTFTAYSELFVYEGTVTLKP